MSISKLKIALFSGSLLLILFSSVLLYKRNFLEYDELTEKFLDAYHYSKASYCEASQIHTWNCGGSCSYHQDLRSAQVFNNKEFQSQAYCGYDIKAQSVIVAFRGTDQVQNWLSNINFVPVKYLNDQCKDCKIHQGFMNILDSIQFELNQCVINLKKQYNSTSILVTGHSLGGAMATLFAVQLKKLLMNKFQSFELITFGSPRVGNLEFVNYANSLFGNNSFRLVNKQDIVPHLPYNNLGFQHIGTEYWLFDEKDPFSFFICSSSEKGESSLCANSKLLNFSVKDHLHYFGIYSGCAAETQQDKEAEKQDQKNHQ
ncbi:lipase family protein (macronuclear) [Tetrahymena thermophila SB210]|uniref:Lipase family protein n=1 Tax=Tetrahymena thermophila (strain SB210) TaxID=312017 RepID=Q240W1_TETTS|nr:lipase family protein [Tetrahymena thermophila SB210]EAS02303.1 lipase family protein [Tetrahymena thermophila SB210]|eukprot:XP_001022548.1 lipase family protein [Tetrahymena thermophila SB210]